MVETDVIGASRTVATMLLQSWALVVLSVGTGGYNSRGHGLQNRNM